MMHAFTFRHVHIASNPKRTARRLAVLAGSGHSASLFGTPQRSIGKLVPTFPLSQGFFLTTPVVCRPMAELETINMMKKYGVSGRTTCVALPGALILHEAGGGVLAAANLMSLLHLWPHTRDIKSAKCKLRHQLKKAVLRAWVALSYNVRPQRR